jgi:hypothetical protein
MEIGGSGPPPIKQGAGKSHLTVEEPYRLVNLDAATFDWIWRIVEAKYRQHSANGVMPEATDVARRAVIAFREAAGTMDHEALDKKRRRLVRGPKRV